MIALQKRKQRFRRPVQRQEAAEFRLPERYREICPCVIHFSVALTLLSFVIVFLFIIGGVMEVADGVTRADIAAVQHVLPGKITSVKRVRYTEDRFFLDALAQETIDAWCKGAAINPRLIDLCADQYDIKTTPIVTPAVFVLYPDETTGLMRADDREKLEQANVRPDKIAIVDAAFKKRTTPSGLAEILVHVPSIDTLPVVLVEKRRTAILGLIAPVDHYRTDVLLQSMGDIVASMLYALGQPSAADVYLEYWFAPSAAHTPNIKFYAARYATREQAKKLTIQLMMSKTIVPSQ